MLLFKKIQKKIKCNITSQVTEISNNNGFCAIFRSSLLELLKVVKENRELHRLFCTDIFFKDKACRNKKICTFVWLPQQKVPIVFKKFIISNNNSK